MFAEGQYRPETAEAKRLLTHELARVVQRAGMAHPMVQRQENDGEEERRKTGAAEYPKESEYLESILCGKGGEGPFGRTRVSDVFELRATAVGESEEYSSALVRDRRTDKSAGYGIGDWLGEEWEIVGIEQKQLQVIDVCGCPETLSMEGKKGELAPEQSSESPAPAWLPETKDYGPMVHTHPTSSGGSVRQHEIGTLEDYSPGDDVTPQMTFVPYGGKYLPYPRIGAKMGRDFSKEELETHLGIALD